MNGDRGEIERRAYAMWEREGRPNGRDFEHWLAAEAELAAEAGKRAAPARKPRAPRAAARRTTTSRAASKPPAS